MATCHPPGLSEGRQATHPTSGGPPDNSGQKKESGSSAVCSGRSVLRRHAGILSSSMPSLFASQCSTDDGPTFDPSHGLRHDVRIGKPREPALQFSSRVLLAHHVVSLGLLSLGARLGFRHHRRTTVCSVCAISLQRYSLDVAELGVFGCGSYDEYVSVIVFEVLATMVSCGLVLFQFSGLLFVGFVEFLLGGLLFGGSRRVRCRACLFSSCFPGGLGGVGCSVVLSLRAFFVSAVLLEELVYGVSIDFAVFWSFVRFCGIFGVAECPPGGEICGM